MSTVRYAAGLRYLHWLIALSVAGALVLIELKGWLPRGSAARSAVKWGHMQFGLAALLLMLPRLLARLRASVPPIAPALPLWQDRLGRLAHLALYLLVFAVPLLGVTMMLVGGKPWNLLGVPLPTLNPDPGLAKQLEELHETAGNALMWLAIFHAAAALFHHFVRRDDTLRRMLPLAGRAARTD